MSLICDDLRIKLIHNGRYNANERANGRPEADFPPLVKLFDPCGAATWLLTELDPEDHDLAFGLCDLGFGFPELGTVRLSELEEVRGVLSIGIERDLYFRATKTLSAYAEEARLQQKIVA